MKIPISFANTIATGIKSQQYLVFSMIILTIGKGPEPKTLIEPNILMMSFLAISLIGMTLQIVTKRLKKKILFDAHQNHY